MDGSSTIMNNIRVVKIASGRWDEYVAGSIPPSHSGAMATNANITSSSLPLPDDELKIWIYRTSTDDADSSEDESASATGSDSSSMNMNRTMAAEDDDDGDGDVYPALNFIIFIKQFFYNLGGNLSIGGHDHDPDLDEKGGKDGDEDYDENSYEQRFHKNYASPFFRTAANYNCSSSCMEIDDIIPSIALEEVVMPGSRLQQSMSLTLKSNGILAESTVDECVICMEAFDESNPRMPTMCGCGANKTFFHLPCLYMYMDRINTRECPTCRQTLTWEEF